jgi:hypothetical protein
MFCGKGRRAVSVQLHQEIVVELALLPVIEQGIAAITGAALSRPTC